jgi:hypothetical protein
MRRVTVSDFPGPFKCKDCGVWWAGFEHRCVWTVNLSSTFAAGDVKPDFTVRCTCPPDRGDNYAGNCPIHDVQTSYTG